MADFSEKNQILDKVKAMKGFLGHGSEKKLAEFLGITTQTLSGWRTRNGIDWDKIKKALTEPEFKIIARASFENDIEEAGIVTEKILPEHVQAAYLIITEAIASIKLDITTMDPNQVGLILGLTAEEVAKGNEVETRKKLIQRATTLLGHNQANIDQLKV